MGIRVGSIGIALIGLVIALAFALTPTQSDAQCRPGDTLIGQSDKFYFCSHRNCPAMDAQLTSDEDALRQLQRSMALSNRELGDWARENDKAQKDALHRAKTFLVTSLLGWASANREAKLDAIKRDISRAPPRGETVTTKLLKISAFEKSYARLVTQIGALKAAEYPGADAYDTWMDFKAHAKAVGHESQVLATTWADLATDPELQAEFREHGFEFSAATLEQTLGKYPLLTQSIDFGNFLVDYGYDADHWIKSRQIIEQNAKLSDTNLYAECVLSRRLKITVRNIAICHGNVPSDTAPRPEDIQCVNHSAS